MTLNENKKKTIVRTGGTLAVITSVALNLITVLDWFGISPKESAARSMQTVQAVHEVEYAPLAVDYGLQEDIIEEAVIYPEDHYVECVMEEPEQVLTPEEEYYIPAAEAIPMEGYAVPGNAPQILNAVQLTDFIFSDASDINGGFALRPGGTDNFGQEYSPAFLTDTPVLLTSEHEYLRYNQYYLDEQYDLFSGTVFLTEEYAQTPCYAYFEIYGDGVLLDCYAFTGTTPPQKFEVDVTGVELLEIRETTPTSGTPTIGLANAFFVYY